LFLLPKLIPFVHVQKVSKNNKIRPNSHQKKRKRERKVFHLVFFSYQEDVRVDVSWVMEFKSSLHIFYIDWSIIEVLQTRISKSQRSLSWNVWVLHTMEQSCSTCYHLKWGKPRTQIPSKLWWKIGYGKTSLHINLIYNFFK